jgi:hypothetical protein
MSLWEYRTATAAKLARIEEDPRQAVLTQLRRGIDAAHKAIKSTEQSDQQVASSDANLAYSKALSLMTQAQAAITDPIVQEQFTHLEVLLRRIDPPAE